MKKHWISLSQNFITSLLIVNLLLVAIALPLEALSYHSQIKTLASNWSGDIILSTVDMNASGDPAIAAEGSSVHVVYRDYKGDAMHPPLYYRKSINEGATWMEEKKITYLEPTGFPIDPRIEVEGNTIHLVYSAPDEVYYKRSIDNGDSWGSDILLSENDGYGSWGPDIAVSGNNVHVVWEDNGYGLSQLEICYKRGLDNGTYWDDGQGNIDAVRRLTVNIDTRSDMPLIRANDDTLHVFWNDEDTGVYEPYYMRSFDNGNIWTEAKNLTISDGIPSWIFDVTVEEEKIYVVGGDRKWVSGIPYYSIWYINSSDNGVTWGERVTLVDAKGGYYCGDGKIQAEDSNIHIVWEDNRDDPGAAPDVESGPCEIYYKKSNNDGINWTIDARVTYAPNDSLEADMVVEVGFVHLIWQDKRRGNYEVFYKRSPDFASNITLTAEPNILTADGVSSSAITARVTNKTGTPLQGMDVNFNIETGSGTLLQSSNVTDSNGTTTVTFVAGTSLGEIIINVSCDGIWNKTTITLLSGSITEIKIIPGGPINLCVNATQQFTAVAYDQYGNINTSWVPYWHANGNVGIINDVGFFTATKKGSGAVNCTDNITGVYNVSIVNILNSMPMIEPVSNQTAYEGQIFILQINAADLDNDILTFSDNSTLFDINSTTGLISFTPNYTSAGDYRVNITVTDGEATIWQTFKLTVLNVNRKPVLGQIDNQTAYEGLRFVLQITATDPDNDTLAFSDNTDLFDINSTTGLISFTPSYDSAGIYWINITVTDGTDIVWQEFQLTIINVNRAPVVIIASPANNSKFTTNDNIVFDATGSYDPDDETLTYTWTSNIGGNIGNTKTFSIKLSAETHVITLVVSDGIDTSSKEITITVESPPPQQGWRFIPIDGAIGISTICAVIAVIMILRKLKKIR